MGRSAGRRGSRRRWVLVAVVVAGLVAAGAPPPPVVAGQAAAALSVRGTSQPADRWDWPLRPEPAVLAPADLPTAPWQPGHRGVDLAAAEGQQVLAPADGVVSFAGTVVDRGVVTVTHPGGLRSSFEPVRSLLPVGTAVRRGEPVAAREGTGGHCGAGCLHWGVRRGDVYLDPLTLLDPPGPPVLLPLNGHAAALGPARPPAARPAPPVAEQPRGTRTVGRWRTVGQWRAV